MWRIFVYDCYICEVMSILKNLRMSSIEYLWFVIMKRSIGFCSRYVGRLSCEYDRFFFIMIIMILSERKYTWKYKQWLWCFWFFGIGYHLFVFEKKTDIISEEKRNTFIIRTKSLIYHSMEELESRARVYIFCNRFLIEMDRSSSLFWSWDSFSEIEIIFMIIKNKISWLAFVLRLIDIGRTIDVKTVEIQKN